LGNYFSFLILFKLFLFSFIPFYLWKKLPSKLNVKRSFLHVLAILFSLLFLSYPVYKAIKTQRIETIYKNLAKHLISAPPWQMILGYSNYQRELKEVESFLIEFNHTRPLQQISEQNKPLPTTVVIVIGESSNRLHFGLYGYHRDTNPKLSSIKNELMVFKNVFASRPNTIESLEQVLSFADQFHPDLYKTKPTLIAMMKQAGYKTFWISNQQTLTSRNTILTTFAKQTDLQVWLNNSRSQNSYSFDEKVLAPFEEMAKDDAPKKLIIVHLIGTHMSYQYRYPKSYDYFKGSEGLFKGLSEDKIQKINEYDNAVRYNDNIVFELIKRLKATNHHSALVYFSDHGDDVYDSGNHDFQGRNEDAPTLAMYAVPFVMWTSENWFNRPYLNSPKILDRQYNNADFIHSWSDLLGITYHEYVKSKSIFSPDFIEDEIIVGDPYQSRKLKHLEGTR
jgi:heptose-I-phosphate ethanolaminephosphotransferase